MGNNSSDMAWLLTSLVGYFCSNGQYDDAILYYEHALTIYDSEAGVDNISLVDIFIGLGWVYDYQGKYEKALSYYK